MRVQLPMLKPNIVLLLCDDLGFNDVSFHGSPQILTPHIDRLATTGLRLENYRSQPVCSPTRASLLSGRHAIHHGIYMPFARGSPLRLSLNLTLLPQLLATLGYDRFAIGKWHLGQNEVATLPTSRGFNSHYGYWTGAEDHYNHQSPQINGSYDFADNLRTCREANGTYGNDLFVQRAVSLIEGRRHQTCPFFLYLAFQNVHWPLQAPEEYVKRYANTTGEDWRRQYVAAMASAADDAVGAVVSAMERTGLKDSSLIIFLSDNGGPTNGNEGTWSSNYPLRGGKNTLWEGGTRVVAVVSGMGVGKSQTGKTTKALFHAVDWLPTLVHLASGSADWLARTSPVWLGREVGRAQRIGKEPMWMPGDGVDQLALLLSGKPVRNEVVLEAHPEEAWVVPRRMAAGYQLPLDEGQVHAQSTVADDTVHGDALVTSEGWKLIRIGSVRPKEESGWVPPPGQDPKRVPYSAGCDIRRQPKAPPSVLRKQCIGPTWCLFNILDDPCEYEDVASRHPGVVADLVQRLKRYQATAVPPVSPDGSCEPIVVDGVWRPCDAPIGTT